MKTAQVPFSRLSASPRWMIDGYINGDLAKPAGDLLRPLSQLACVRRETIDPVLLGSRLVAYIGLENVASMTGELVEFKPVPAHDIKSRSRRFLPGDILYGRLRPYLNKVLLVPLEMGEGICSNEFVVLAAKLDLVDPTYLRAALASTRVLKKVAGLQTGSTLPRLQAEDLLNIDMPVPSMSIQKQIASAIQEREEERRVLRSRLAALAEDVFEEMLSDLSSSTPRNAPADGPGSQAPAGG